MCCSPGNSRRRRRSSGICRPENARGVGRRSVSGAACSDGAVLLRVGESGSGRRRDEATRSSAVQGKTARCWEHQRVSRTALARSRKCSGSTMLPFSHQPPPRALPDKNASDGAERVGGGQR